MGGTLDEFVPFPPEFKSYGDQTTNKGIGSMASVFNVYYPAEFYETL